MSDPIDAKNLANPSQPQSSSPAPQQSSPQNNQNAGPASSPSGPVPQSNPDQSSPDDVETDAPAPLLTEHNTFSRGRYDAVANGYMFSAPARRAFKRFDPHVTAPQPAEMWEFKDPGLARYKRF